MTTINLEKELIRANKKVIIASELLLIKEYDKLAEQVNSDALARVGLLQALREGRRIKHRIDFAKSQTEQFDQERVFHVSQIKAICERYRLRFLPARFYRGTIDADLPNRMETFEMAYGVICGEHNTKIMAPIESFKLQMNPKDPLFFYEINEDYFYLIHKWGNDLSIFRRLLTLFESVFFTWLFIAAVWSLWFLVSHKIGISALVFGVVFSTILQVVNGFAFRLLPKNKWNSKHID